MNSTNVFGPKFIRIFGVPQDWTEDDVLNGLLAVEPTCLHQVQEYDLAQYPECSGTCQRGFFTWENVLDLLNSSNLEESHWKLQNRISEEL
jgi:hypothetical protein